MDIRSTEFETARKAVEAKGEGEAIRLDGKYLVVSGEDADRLAAAGREFAYLCRGPQGRILTVPVDGDPEACSPAGRAEAVERIARKELGLETLEERKSDRLDFHELSVWGIKRALEAAFDAGTKANAKGKE